MTENEPKDPLAPPLLEVMGALSSLIIHDMANHLCIISGNATFAELVKDDPEKLANAISGIARASELAANALNRAGDLRRGMADKVDHGTLAELGSFWSMLAERYPGWNFDPALSTDRSLRMPAKWIAYCLACLIDETSVEVGTARMELAYPPDEEVGETGGNPPRPRALVLRLEYRAAEPLSIKHARGKYDNLGLLASFELNRGLGGKIDTATVAEGEQVIVLRVPFV